MSYSFQVQKKDGEITVVNAENAALYVPDGTFGISGHEDGNSRSISISRLDPDGRPVANANGTGYIPVAGE